MPEILLTINDGRGNKKNISGNVTITDIPAPSRIRQHAKPRIVGLVQPLQLVGAMRVDTMVLHTWAETKISGSGGLKLNATVQ